MHAHHHHHPIGVPIISPAVGSQGYATASPPPPPPPAGLFGEPGALPFTGLDLTFFAILAAALVIGGTILRIGR